jgi:hypothetical protein
MILKMISQSQGSPRRIAMRFHELEPAPHPCLAYRVSRLSWVILEWLNLADPGWLTPADR